jgi:hypothetical protein
VCACVGRPKNPPKQLATFAGNIRGSPRTPFRLQVHLLVTGIVFMVNVLITPENDLQTTYKRKYSGLPHAATIIEERVLSLGMNGWNIFGRYLIP